MYQEPSRNFESNRILAGVGAILAAIGALVVFRGPVGIIGIVGMILVLIATRGLADDYKNHAIYRNALTAVTLGLIGTFIAIAVFAAFDFLSGFIFNHPIVGVLGYIFAIGGWLVMFLFFMLAGVFFNQAFGSLAHSSGVSVLRTGGLNAPYRWSVDYSFCWILPFLYRLDYSRGGLVRFAASDAE